MSFALLLTLFVSSLVVFCLVAAGLLLVPLGRRELLRNYPLAGLAILIPLVGLVLYLFTGRPGAYLDYQQTKAAIREEGATQTLLRNLAELEEELVGQPDNDQLRLSLARVYWNLGQLDKAVALMSHPLVSENEESFAFRLQLHYQKTGWGEEVESLASRLAELNDENPTLLSLRAAEAFKRQDYQEAIDLWRLLLVVEISAEEEQEILRLIKEAQRALNLQL